MVNATHARPFAPASTAAWFSASILPRLQSPAPLALSALMAPPPASAPAKTLNSLAAKTAAGVDELEPEARVGAVGAEAVRAPRRR